MFRFPLLSRCALVAALLCLPMQCAIAHQATASPAPGRAPPDLAVTRVPDRLPAGVEELKFRDVFKLPVGPQGLEATERLRQLDGKHVRIVGYMVNHETPTPGGFLLSPLPVAAGDEDESLADDIPATAITVTLPKASTAIVPALQGLIRITGTLRVGGFELPGSGRVSPARIELDAAPERALLGLVRNAARKPSTAR